MSNEQDDLATLAHIRSVMDRSTRYLSLSGLSGVFAGIFALCGALGAFLFLNSPKVATPYLKTVFNILGEPDVNVITFLIFDACIVLFASLAVCFFLTYRNAVKQDSDVWNNASRRLTINLLIPLTVGGLFCLILFLKGHASLAAPAMLIFYGLALVNASKFTHDDIRTLGILETILGLAATVNLHYALIFWALGFGVLHVVYGIVMYRKYEIVKKD